MTRRIVFLDPMLRRVLSRSHVSIRIKALGEQLRLNLREPQPMRRETFVVSDCNAAAVALVDAWPRWPGGALALVGPAGAGKTHLAAAWAGQAGATAVGLDETAPTDGALLVEDADRASAEERLFHLLNRAAVQGHSLLLTARTRPADWPTALPDLRSRLNALPVAELGEPDDGVLRGVLERIFAERLIKPSPELLAYLCARIERSAPAAEAAVERLEQAASNTGRPITRALAQTLFVADPDPE